MGIRLIKLHLVDYPIIDELTREFSQTTWILPHLGCYGRGGEMEKYCRLARDRKNVYLDTSGVAPVLQLRKGDRVVRSIAEVSPGRLVARKSVMSLSLSTVTQARSV